MSRNNHPRSSFGSGLRHRAASSIQQQTSANWQPVGIGACMGRQLALIRPSGAVHNTKRRNYYPCENHKSHLKADSIQREMHTESSDERTRGGSAAATSSWWNRRNRFHFTGQAEVYRN
ncbi:hypothetical protein PAMA_006692 [Pampus argenteus]